MPAIGPFRGWLGICLYKRLTANIKQPDTMWYAFRVEQLIKSCPKHPINQILARIVGVFLQTARLSAGVYCKAIGSIQILCTEVLDRIRFGLKCPVPPDQRQDCPAKDWFNSNPVYPIKSSVFATIS